MARGIGGIDGMFEVETRCRGTEAEGGHVFFHAGLQCVDLFRGAACANDHYPAGERIKCACMADFEFRSAHGLRQ